MYKPTLARLSASLFLTTLFIIGTALALDKLPDEPTSEPSAIQLVKNDDGSYKLTAKSVSVKALADRIAAETGIALTTDDELANQIVSVDETHPDLESLIKSISDSNAIVFERIGDEIRLVSAFVTSQQDAVVPPEAEAADPVNDDPAGEKLVIGYRLTNLRPDTDRSKLNPNRLISMRNALIDTSRAKRGIGIEVPPALAARPDTRWHIVQFDGKITDDRRQALEAAGFKIGHYIPQNALSVQASPDRLDALKAIEGVYFVEPYHPYLKVSEDILGYLSGEAPKNVKEKVEKGRISILTHHHELDTASIAGLIEVENKSLLMGAS